MKKIIVKKIIHMALSGALVLMFACSSGYDDGNTNSVNYGSTGSGSSGSSSSGLSAGTSTSYNSTVTVDTEAYSNVIYLNITDGKDSSDGSEWTEIVKSKQYFFGESTD